MRDKTTLEKIIAPTIAALGYELLGCVYIPSAKSAVLRVYIDSVNGIMIADCERVSRQVSAVLDVEDPLAGKYFLEVSSPGLDRPLFTLDHFRRFIGEEVNIRLHTMINNRKHVKGLLTGVEEDNVIVALENEKFILPFSNILKANLVHEEINPAPKTKKKSN